jgi:nucleotide-binding universal stress UspA family protein
MKPIKSILVPVDFSPHSSLALEYAADLAHRYEATLEVVFVYQAVAFAMPEGYVLVTPDQLAEILSRFQLQLEAAKRQALALGAPNVSSALLQGDPIQEIVQRVSERNHDLIVMGTNGRRGVKRVFLGSVAENVVRSASCPVLTVRAAE